MKRIAELKAFGVVSGKIEREESDKWIAFADALEIAEKFLRTVDAATYKTRLKGDNS